MIQENELTNLVFFDLETSAEYESYEALQAANPRKAELWATKYEKAVANNKDNGRWSEMSMPESYSKMAPLSAEFGRIVCGSFSYITENTENGTKLVAKLKSFYDTEGTESSERKLLEGIVNLLKVVENHPKLGNMRLCGHNIKKFDIPFLTKRLIVHNLLVPRGLQIWGKKPWEILHLDTQEMWQMSTWEFISLDLLACTLGVPSPKDQMKGEYVGEAFWKDNDYLKIAEYCEEDVKCGVRICHRLSNSEYDLSFVSDLGKPQVPEGSKMTKSPLA